MKEYISEDLIVYWDAKECSHAGICWRELPQVFKPKERPWINIMAASPEDIIKAIDKCPTDALKYKLPEGSKIDPAIAQGPGSLDYKQKSGQPIQIKVVKNGPFLVKGAAQVIDSNGNILKDSSHIVLCRCGLSSNQPFCDGAHARNK